MHEVYAIEPENLCNSWERFDRVFIEGMGYGQGRVMAVVPKLKDWMRDAKSNPALDQMGPVRKKSITDKYLQRGGAEFIRRTAAQTHATSGNGSSWLEKAEDIHTSLQFKAILAEENPRNHQSVVPFDSIGGECVPWTVRSSGRIHRNVDALCACTEQLLKQSRKVAFVDPHFCFEPRFLNVLKKNLEHLHNSPHVIESIEFNCAYNPEKWTQERQDNYIHNFKHSIQKETHRFLPSGADELAKVMSFKVWKNTTRSRVHPRLVLTDIAGLNIESGLDTAPEPEAITPVFRISGVELLESWAEYIVGKSPFDLIEEIPVQP